MLTRRGLAAAFACAPIAFAAGRGRASADVVPGEVVLGDDGLHKQDWFIDSFLELRDDYETAAAEGRGLAVLFEQRGCPYCRELHAVNFAKPEIVAAMAGNFDTVQLDLWGSREVVDLDDEAAEERRLAGKWAVNFTPTLILFPAENVGAATAREAEAFRMPGYFKPFHFIAGLQYVARGRWRDVPFQRHLQDVFAELEAKGIEPEVW